MGPIGPWFGLWKVVSTHCFEADPVDLGLDSNELYDTCPRGSMYSYVDDRNPASPSIHCIIPSP